MPDTIVIADLELTPVKPGRNVALRETMQRPGRWIKLPGDETLLRVTGYWEVRRPSHNPFDAHANRDPVTDSQLG